MLNRLNGPAFREMIMQAAYAVEIKKQELNDLNVFPVPDGDTGINMSMTINAAANELKKHSADKIGTVADTVAMAMLRGARGNSGVILSLLFRGFSKKLRGLDDAGAAEFAEALASGVDAAYKAVMKPTEGTILTVSRLAAEAAADAANTTGDLAAVLECTCKAAHEALEATTELNPVLKKAGVVDAGGAGFTVILDVFNSYIHGEKLEIKETIEETKPTETPANPFDVFDTEDIHFAYCTEFIIDRINDLDPSVLRAYLETIGDCVVVVDDEDIIKVHVHSNNPGKVIEKALEFGSLDRIKIENMKIQHTNKIVEQIPEAKEDIPAEPKKPYAFVAVAAGEGLHNIFNELGAEYIVDGGQTMNPSTADIFEAVEKVNSDTVYILPNNKNIIMAAQQVQPLTSKEIHVVETRTVCEGISAMLSFSPDCTPEKNIEAMKEAYSAVITGEVTYAARNSTFDDRKINEGDYLALLGGKLVESSADKSEVFRQLAQNMCENRENEISFINIIYGEGVEEKDTAEVRSYFANVLPEAEINITYGGQPVYYYIISAE